jgi:hypothetical protein
MFVQSFFEEDFFSEGLRDVVPDVEACVIAQVMILVAFY